MDKETDYPALVLQDGFHFVTPNHSDTPVHSLDSRPLVEPYFNFPMPRNIKSKDEILQSEHIRELKSVLLSGNFKRLIMTVTTVEYKEVLLNWLTVATGKARIPLEDILVIALDEPLYVELKKRGIKTAFIPIDAVVHPLLMGETKKGWVVINARFPIIRLVSHWGYDVMTCDSDALIFRDPQPLFDQHHQSAIIGQLDRYPIELYHEWGHTMCGGVLFFRYSRETGKPPIILKVPLEHAHRWSIYYLNMQNDHVIPMKLSRRKTCPEAPMQG